jgi:thioredoxin-dependent peroxiredoxin
MAKKKVAKKVAKKTTKKVTKKAAAKKAPAKKVAKEIAAPGLKIGSKAPGFKLEDQNGNPVALADFKGKFVVLYFYPKALTPGCTVQACGLRDSRQELERLEVVSLGVSADPVKKLKQFEEKYELDFLLLSDPDHQVTEAYGCWGLKQFMGREFMGILRQTFIIDRQGKIAHVMAKVNTKTHHDDVLKIIKSLE